MSRFPSFREQFLLDKLFFGDGHVLERAMMYTGNKTRFAAFLTTR